MPTVAAAGIAAYATYKAASKQSSSQDKSTQSQSESNKEALDFLKEKQKEYDEQMAPYRQLGQSGLSKLQGLLGMGGGGGNSFGGGGGLPRVHTESSTGANPDETTKDLPQETRVGQLYSGPGIDPREAALRELPGYQFAVKSGMGAATSSPFMRRLVGGGGANAALDDYTHGLADQTYEEWINDFLNMAKLGVPPPPS